MKMHETNHYWSEDGRGDMDLRLHHYEGRTDFLVGWVTTANGLFEVHTRWGEDAKTADPLARLHTKQEAMDWLLAVAAIEGWLR